MGDYRSTVNSDSPAEEGKSHYVFGPVSSNLIEVKGVEFTVSSDGSPAGDTEFKSFFSSTVGVIGSKFTFSDTPSGNVVAGNELTFVTPRLATGIWTKHWR